MSPQDIDYRKLSGCNLSRRIGLGGPHATSLSAETSIQGDSLQLASGLLVRKNVFLIVDNVQQIHFQPLKRSGQLHAVRPGIESRGEVYHKASAILNLAQKKRVKKIRARHPCPVVLVSIDQSVAI